MANPSVDFPQRLFVVQRPDGEDHYYDAVESVEDWKPEAIDNMPVAVYELKTVGRTITSRRFVLPPGETL